MCAPVDQAVRSDLPSETIGTSPGPPMGTVGARVAADTDARPRPAPLPLPSTLPVLIFITGCCRGSVAVHRTAASLRQGRSRVGRCPRFRDCSSAALINKSTKSRVSRNACDSRMSVCFLTRATCKNVRQNLIPRATAYPPPCPQSACARVSE